MLLQATLRRSKVLASAAAALQVHMPVEQQQLAPAGARSLHLESVQQVCNLVSKRIPTSPWALQYSSSAQSESAVANGSESELVGW